MQQATVFDMDGTLANVQAIRHYVVAPEPVGTWKPNFNAFHRAACSAFIEPNWEVLEALKADAARDDRAVLIVSARAGEWMVPSLRWLASKGGSWDDTYFRGYKDFRPDRVVKAELWEQIVADGYEVVEAWDDNPAIIKLWHELGVPEIHTVEGWDLDPREEALA